MGDRAQNPFRRSSGRGQRRIRAEDLERDRELRGGVRPPSLEGPARRGTERKPGRGARPATERQDRGAKPRRRDPLAFPGPRLPFRVRWWYLALLLAVVVATSFILTREPTIPWEPTEAQVATAESAGVSLVTTNSLGMELVVIPRGTFAMGSGATEPFHRPEENLHTVRLSRALLVGRHEVDVESWKLVLGEDPSQFRDGPRRRPVESVTWREAIDFCNALSAREGLERAYEIEDGEVRLVGLGIDGYRLPTEAEWEYLCRAGTSTLFWLGDSLPWEACNYDSRKPLPGGESVASEGRPVAVGSYGANPWGLYDVHGNVAEWCWDGFDPRYSTVVKDPTGPAQAEERVFRGGSWFNSAAFCRSAQRHKLTPHLRRDFVGFRVVRTLRIP